MSGKKSEDINDLHKSGSMPDPRKSAQPVTETAKVSKDDDARVYSMKDLFEGAAKRALAPKSKQIVCTTGHHDLDEATGGFQPGYVWVWGAETSWGKSSEIVMICAENRKVGKRVLIVTVEDPPDSWADRMMIRYAKVSAQRYRGKSLDADELGRVVSGAKGHDELPVLLDARGKSVEWAAKHTKRLIAEHDISLVCFDYLQAFDQEKPERERRLQLNYIARTLTDAVKTMNVAGVIFSQITVEDGKRPTKYSIRDSKDVPNAAEVVVLGWVADKDQKSQNRVIVEKDQKCIILDKNKNGPAKKIWPMNWDNATASFQVVAPERDAPIPPDDYDVNYDEDGMPHSLVAGL